jgi:hypothetical protein
LLLVEVWEGTVAELGRVTHGHNLIKVVEFHLTGAVEH